MSDDTSVRLGLALLQAGQAQKELSHNEALTLLDVAVQAAVEAVGLDTPPPAPTAGACWIVGAAPSGAWAGRAQALAGWTSGGWRFVDARDGMTAWSLADGAFARFAGGAWSVGLVTGTHLVLGGNAVVGSRQPAIAGPAGGATVDAEVRAAVGAILSALCAHGLIAT